jgi:hypothetical protein
MPKSFIQEILEIIYGDTLEDRQYTQEEVIAKLKERLNN